MDDTWKKVTASAVIAAVAAGSVGFGLGDNSADADVVNKLNQANADLAVQLSEVDRLSSKVTALENMEPLVETVEKEVEVEVDSAETLAELEKARSDLADAEKALSLFDEDDVVERMNEDAAFAEVGVLLSGEDLDEDQEELMDDMKEDLLEALDDLGWNVEESEDLLSVKLLDNSDLDYDLDEDDEGVEGTVSGEVRVRFRTDGPDGDRHSERLQMEFHLEDGEVESYSFEE